MIDARKNQSKRRFWGGMRIACAILCMVFLLGMCVGCVPHASEDEVAELKGSLDDALQQITYVDNKYASTLQELEDLKTAYDEAAAELEALRADCEAAQKELEAADQAGKEAGEAAQAVIDQLKESCDSAEQEIETLKGELASAKDELAFAKDELASLGDNYDAAMQEIETLKEQLKDLDNGNADDEDTSDKIKIYIDQGHNPTGSHNTGATGNGLYEQDITFTIGILLADLLKQDGRFEVCLSRPNAYTVLGTDNNTSLDARVQGAEDFGADYFISLHINSFTDSAVTGIEIYTLEANSESYYFGDSVLKGLIASTGLRNRGMKLSSSLRVLNNAKMPAILVEMGFISNPSDAAMLSDTPEVFATGIYNGILSYFRLELNITPAE